MKIQNGCGSGGIQSRTGLCEDVARDFDGAAWMNDASVPTVRIVEGDGFTGHREFRTAGDQHGGHGEVGNKC